MPAFSNRYCGMVLYLANSAAQSEAFSGGIAPVTGFHWVIDSPESVSRVAPPTTTMASTRTATAISQTATARERSERRNEVIWPRWRRFQAELWRALKPET